MKKLSFVIVFIFALVTTYAQNDTIPPVDEPVIPDTIKVEEEDKDIRGIEISIGDTDKDSTSYTRRVKTRWLLIDYGISTYLADGKLNLPASMNALDQRLWGSNHWDIQLVQQQIKFDKKGHVRFVYGAGFEINRYRFQNDITLLEEQPQVTVVDNPGEDFKKNHLQAAYLKVPVMMRFSGRLGKSKTGIRLGVGGYGSLLIASKTKQKLDGDKTKIRDDFNLNRVQYGVTARAGVGPVNFYVNYGLSDLFDKDENGGYEVQPISFGISIVPF